MVKGEDVGSLIMERGPSGASDERGAPIMRGGKQFTHGWTPVNRGENVIDQDTNEKVNALYLQYHKK